MALNVDYRSLGLLSFRVKQIPLQEVATLASREILESNTRGCPATSSVSLATKMQICNSRRPEESGTLVSDRRDELTEGVKVIAHKTQMTAIDIKSTPAFLANGFLQSIKRIFMRRQTDLYITGMSEGGVSLVCAYERGLSPIVQELERLGSVRIQKTCALVSLSEKDYTDQAATRGSFNS